ncbi:hypothetical protein Tco_0264349 [Tanacetum coccineum]
MPPRDVFYSKVFILTASLLSLKDSRRKVQANVPYQSLTRNCSILSFRPHKGIAITLALPGLFVVGGYYTLRATTDSGLQFASGRTLPTAPNSRS